MEMALANLVEDFENQLFCRLSSEGLLLEVVLKARRVSFSVGQAVVPFSLFANRTNRPR